MTLSVIIVSYNVQYFLDQAIGSVLESSCDFDFEIIVVDNGSTDNSVKWVEEKYPEVRVFDLGENVGFARANNFAAHKAKGEYILLLNPDTIVQADSLQCCYDFLSERKGAGAVGLRMYDGQGKYLPESKRGFPSPWTSFCKITGLNELFPDSKIFNYYYLGHKSSDIDQEVDVLTGAFMMLKKDNYLELGGLDEDFFMYGEDIDLCYRLYEKGYQNYYLASSSIIHFKGESTSKQSLKYIKTFYSAMSIYAGKHYNKHILALMSVFIQAAIYARAGLAILIQKVRNAQLFIQHFIWVFLGLLGGHYLTHSELYMDYRFWVSPLIFAGIAQIQHMGWDRWNWWDQFVGWTLASVLILPMVFISDSPLWPVSIALSLLFYILQLIVHLPGAFLPELQKDHRALTWISDAARPKVKKMLDQLPGANRITALQPAISVNSNRTSAGGTYEFIFDPSQLSWTEIVTLLITEGREKVNRILSSDQDCLITSRSKNEAAILINEDYLKRKRLESVHRLKKKHEFVLCLALTLLFPISLPYFGLKGWSQAAKSLFRSKSSLLNESDSSTFLPKGGFNKEQRAEWVNERQYNFSRYQKKLWYALRNA